jgi:hypothetical protein
VSPLPSELPLARLLRPLSSPREPTLPVGTVVRYRPLGNGTARIEHAARPTYVVQLAWLQPVDGPLTALERVAGPEDPVDAKAP